jgi:hypothetical protein
MPRLYSYRSLFDGTATHKIQPRNATPVLGAVCHLGLQKTETVSRDAALSHPTAVNHFFCTPLGVIQERVCFEDRDESTVICSC